MPKFCPFCGKPLPHPGAEVCQACGAQFRPPAQPPATSPAQPQAKPATQPPARPQVQPQAQPPATSPAQPQAKPPARPPARPPASAPGAGGTQVRNPILAVIFSFFFPGWGQWYNGQRWEGLKFFLASFIIVLGSLATVILLGSESLPATALRVVLGLASIGVWLFGMYHAYTTAQRINRGEVAFERKSRLFWLPVALIIVMIVMLIIAAVFAAFIFGMVGGMLGQGPPGLESAGQGAVGKGGYERTNIVAATAKQSGDTIYVTWQGGRDNGLVTSYGVAIMSSTGVTDYVVGIPPNAGEITSFEGGTAGQDHVVVMATFTDGTQQVVLDTYV